MSRDRNTESLEDTSIVFIYKDNCPYCNKIKPIFDEVSGSKKCLGLKYKSINNKSREAKKIFESSGYKYSSIDGKWYSRIDPTRNVTYPIFFKFKKDMFHSVFNEDSVTKRDKLLVFISNVTDVKNSNVDTFKRFIKNKNTIVAMVYADWCGYCTIAKPLFSSLSCRNKSITINSNHKKIIDYLNNLKLNGTTGIIQGYPTFLKFKNGELLSMFGGNFNDKIEFSEYLNNSV